ncbi:unnamed protein product [Peronospora destructor]|uniref:Uncharacterized protein n=1 Tax=Peronospora destructor TaxID=86335 RepID=A0AAV0TVQ5_9STRA|nr:unnamed protein product [Peronospora destructor]
MEQGGFCIGPGSVMGTNGFKWTGRDPMDDCSILWLETWGLTSLLRAVLACLVVFLLSVLCQYLTTADGCQLQQSKVFAKRRLARKRTQENISSNGVTFYDPELGDGGRKSQKEELVVHPERPELLPEMDTKTTTSFTMERVGFVTGFFAFSKDTAKVPVSADPCCS